MEPTRFANSPSPLELVHLGPCTAGFQLGFLIGQRFSTMIKSRVSRDLILQEQLLPFAETPDGKSLIQSLSETNTKRYPVYWDELLGMAEGSGAPTLHIMLLNFRKEVVPFIPNVETKAEDYCCEDCSDVLVVSDSMAVVAHNEDANVALLGHTFLLKVKLLDGVSFTAYTYAGELPSCAFGFNSHGMAFTLNAVPPANEEMVAGGIARNFISRDLLEATDLDDAVARVCASNVSVGHSYNLVDVMNRRVLNVETASNLRYSIKEISTEPFFHANMYLHLQVKQVQNESSISRQERAALLPTKSTPDLLWLLGDTENKEFPIYMTGPTLHTLCTVLIDLVQQTLSIFECNPREGKISYLLPLLELNRIPVNEPHPRIRFIETQQMPIHAVYSSHQ